MGQRVAIIGAGITGLAAGQLLKQRDRQDGHVASREVVVFEGGARPGGLVYCDRVDGYLFHRVGGHVFNSKIADVLDWFWSFFDREGEFLKARRNARILFEGQLIGYPIENSLRELGPERAGAIIDELLAIERSGAARRSPLEYEHFQAFLEANFGPTLYRLYFEPYNRKIWQADLSTVPLAWLDGKLPMPNLRQMLMTNILAGQEGEMVHATFYYPRNNGSQFIADRLAQGLTIRLSTPVTELAPDESRDGWRVNGEAFDQVIYTGDVRRLSRLIKVGLNDEARQTLDHVAHLPSNGTSNVLCTCDPTDVSWLYLPDPTLSAHRIIYTGGFSETNNAPGGRSSCTVEFSGEKDEASMRAELKRLPGNLEPLAFNYQPNSYVLQQPDTRDRIARVGEALEPRGLYLAGRFAQWEYHNMDKAIEAAMEVTARMPPPPSPDRRAQNQHGLTADCPLPSPSCCRYLPAH